MAAAQVYSSHYNRVAALLTAKTSGIEQVYFSVHRKSLRPTIIKKKAQLKLPKLESGYFT